MAAVVAPVAAAEEAEEAVEEGAAEAEKSSRKRSRGGSDNEVEAPAAPFSMKRAIVAALETAGGRLKVKKLRAAVSVVAGAAADGSFELKLAKLQSRMKVGVDGKYAMLL